MKKTVILVILIVISSALSAGIAVPVDSDTSVQSDSDLLPDDEDICDGDTISDESQDDDGTPPAYDDFNFPDIPETTDKEDVPTIRITDSGCAALFI